MKQFRDELLEYLYEHSGEMIDIKFLTDKYCGGGNTFENGDDTVPRCRLNLNMVLRELDKMEWINLAPKGGLSTGHHMNHDIMKREFIMDFPVKARMTTKGEIEYKKSKQLNIPTFQVGDNFTGVVNSGTVTNSRVNHASGSGELIAETKIATPTTKSKRPSNKLLKVIGGIIVLALGILKIFGII